MSTSQFNFKSDVCVHLATYTPAVYVIQPFIFQFNPSVISYSRILDSECLCSISFSNIYLHIVHDFASKFEAQTSSLVVYCRNANLSVTVPVPPIHLGGAVQIAPSSILGSSLLLYPLSV